MVTSGDMGDELLSHDGSLPDQDPFSHHDADAHRCTGHIVLVIGRYNRPPSIGCLLLEPQRSCLMSIPIRYFEEAAVHHRDLLPLEFFPWLRRVLMMVVKGDSTISESGSVLDALYSLVHTLVRR